MPRIAKNRDFPWSASEPASGSSRAEGSVSGAPQTQVRAGFESLKKRSSARIQSVLKSPGPPRAEVPARGAVGPAAAPGNVAHARIQKVLDLAESAPHSRSPQKVVSQLVVELQKLGVGRLARVSTLNEEERLAVLEAVAPLSELQGESSNGLQRMFQRPAKEGLRKKGERLSREALIARDGMTVNRVKRLHDVQSTGSFLKPRELEHLSQLRRDPSVPVDDPQAKGLMAVPNELLLEIGRHLRHDDSRGRTDVNALAAATRRTAELFEGDRITAWKEKFSPQVDHIYFWSDFDRCAAAVNLLPKEIGSEETPSRQAGLIDQLQRYGTALDDGPHHGLGRHDFLYPVDGTMGDGAERATAWASLADAARQLSENVPDCSGSLISLPERPRGALIVALLRHAKDDGLALETKQHIVQSCTTAMATLSTQHRALLLPFLHQTQANLDSNGNATRDVMERAQATFEKMRADCEGDKCDVRAPLWSMIHLLHLLPPSKQKEAAQVCMNLYPKLTPESNPWKPALILSLCEWALPALQDDQEAIQSGATKCLEWTRPPHSFGKIVPEFGAALMRAFQGRPATLEQIRMLLDNFDESGAGRKEFSSRLDGFLPLGWPIPHLPPERDERRSALRLLRATLSKCDGSFVAAQMGNLLRPLVSLAYTAASSPEDARILLEEHAANMKLLGSLTPMHTGKDSKKKGFDIPAMAGMTLRHDFQIILQGLSMSKASAEFDPQLLIDDLTRERDRLLNDGNETALSLALKRLA